MAYTPTTRDPGPIVDPDDIYTPSDEETATESGEDGNPRNHHGRIARGVLSNGTTFPVPETESVLAALLSLRAWATPFNWLWMGTCVLTGATLFLKLPPWFYFLQMVFWRLAYNLGLGTILDRQSKYRWWEKISQKYVLNNPARVKLLESCVIFMDRSIAPYRAKDYPMEFNSWLFYRFVVKIILANDVAAFYTLVVYHFYWPTVDGTFGAAPLWDLTIILRYIAMAVLTVFALWSKSDAHRVIGDYAWYWGDFWFLLDKDLVFDGIFQMFPHPMYTVGYSFMYGCAIASRQYTVFYATVFSHLAQMAFLAFVENPHIDKTYNAISAPTQEEMERDRLLYGPPVEENSRDKPSAVYELPYLDRNELVIFKNFSVYRAGDWLLLVLVIYTVSTGLLVGQFADDLTRNGMIRGGLLWCVLQCVAWRFFHTFCLGYVLRQQSATGWWVDKFNGNTKLAFQNWKTIYNVTVTMMQLSYFIVVLRCVISYIYVSYADPNFKPNFYTSYSWGAAYSVLEGSDNALVVIGILLFLINAYVVLGVFDALGPFGYFFGDFFIRDVPAGTLSYSGIYRYLNNPDNSLGFAGYYGVALLCPKTMWHVILPLALFSQLAAKFFQKWVEEPHMKRRYGSDQLRSEGGLRSEIKRRAKRVKSAMIAKRDEYERSIKKLRSEIEEKTAVYERLKQSISPKKAKKATTGTGKKEN